MEVRAQPLCWTERQAARQLNRDRSGWEESPGVGRERFLQFHLRAALPAEIRRIKNLSSSSRC